MSLIHANTIGMCDVLSQMGMCEDQSRSRKSEKCKRRREKCTKSKLAAEKLVHGGIEWLEGWKCRRAASSHMGWLERLRLKASGRNTKSDSSVRLDDFFWHLQKMAQDSGRSNAGQPVSPPNAARNSFSPHTQQLQQQNPSSYGPIGPSGMTYPGLHPGHHGLRPYGGHPQNHHIPPPYQYNPSHLAEYGVGGGNMEIQFPQQPYFYQHQPPVQPPPVQPPPVQPPPAYPAHTAAQPSPPPMSSFQSQPAPANRSSSSGPPLPPGFTLTYACKECETPIEAREIRDKNNVLVCPDGVLTPAGWLQFHFKLREEGTTCIAKMYGQPQELSLMALLRYTCGVCNKDMPRSVLEKHALVCTPKPSTVGTGGVGVPAAPAPPPVPNAASSGGFDHLHHRAPVRGGGGSYGDMYNTQQHPFQGAQPIIPSQQHPFQGAQPIIPSQQHPFQGAQPIIPSQQHPFQGAQPTIPSQQPHPQPTWDPMQGSMVVAPMPQFSGGSGGGRMAATAMANSAHGYPLQSTGIFSL